MLTVLRLLVLVVVVTLLGTGVPHAVTGIASASAAADHLVVSEVVTGASGASDELIELYNPTAGSLPLEGLELVYASASGLTVSRRATWELGADEVPPGGHVLVANELGVYAPIADATYASGMAATGGSVALRIVGAATAIDAIGWGSAASTWLEGSVAPAPAAGSSLERLPGGSLGSTQDTDDNAADFVVRSVPGPENSASRPVPAPSSSASPQPSVAPSASPTLVPTPSPTTEPTAGPTPPPTTEPTAEPTAEPSPSSSDTPSPQPTTTPSPDPVVPIAVARAFPDGTRVTVEGIALTGSDFADGGGHLVDDSGGLAVLLSDGAFARGDRLRVTGVMDDRYAQRTLRASAAGLAVLGTAEDPAPLEVATGAVTEELEGWLVRVAGSVEAAPTSLSAGIAFDIDDGSGPIRLLVGSATGIDATAWGVGFAVDAVGVVGQRDSSGTGAAGYRVQPRDAADVQAAGPGPSPSPSPAPSTTQEPTPEPSQPPGLISVAAARQLAKGAVATVRGVVTLAPGTVDPTTAVMQDASGAIVLRIGDEAGPIARGSLVEVRGVRSTLSGMETLRVTTPPRSLGAGVEPTARALRSGEAGESQEASLVVVSGGLVAAPRKSSAGSVSFEIDDGSGPLRVSIGSSTSIGSAQLAAGAWIEVRGVLGQETTGSLPLRGYRIWPRDSADVRVVAPAMAGESSATSPTDDGEDPRPTGMAVGALDDIGAAAAAGFPIGATLVMGQWEELGLGGLLWDGVRLVALHADAGPLVTDLIGSAGPPVAVRAHGLRVVGADAETGVPVVAVSSEPGGLLPSGQVPAQPVAAVDLDVPAARWVAVVGRLGPGSDVLMAGDARLRIDHRCDAEPMPRRGTVSATGILVGDPLRLIVPCGGVVPTPLLTRATAPRAAQPALDPTGALLVSGGESAAGPFPSALLLMAATTLVGGALAGRRLTQRGGPDPDSGTAAAESGEEAEPEASSPPTLTLVPMPRERAP